MIDVDVDVDAGDITNAITTAIADIVDAGDITNAIRSGLSESMPYAELILDTIAHAIALKWTPLPPGSHLRLGDDDVLGVTVVALRSYGFPERVEALSERGGVCRLGDDTRLEIGR